MKTKKVNRYYCEFCKKSGGAAGHMKKHESRCTMNPGRHCGYCDLLESKFDGREQPKIEELLAILPNPDEYIQIQVDTEFCLESFKGLDEAVNAALPKLREACFSCPACIMSALRQKGIPVPCATDFDFKKECQSIWNDFNDSQREYY